MPLDRYRLLDPTLVAQTIAETHFGFILAVYQVDTTRQRVSAIGNHLCVVCVRSTD